MKDKNGIEIKCLNCAYQNICSNFGDSDCKSAALEFAPTAEVLEARIAELQAEIDKWQENAFKAQKKALEAQDKSKKCLQLAAESKLESISYTLRKPRAKRLVWDYIEGKTRAVLTDYMTLFIDEYGYPYRYCFGIEYKDDESTLESRFVREDDAKQAAQEWLDKLVSDCAEMPKED